MGLLNRVQEIWGKKTFKEKVTFDGDVEFNKHITAYAPSEESAGTLHFKYAALLSVNPADTNWHEVDCSPYVPVGAKGISIRIDIQGATAGKTLSISNASAGDVYGEAHIDIANTEEDATALIPLSSARSIFYKVDNADVASVEFFLLGYYI